MKRIVFLTVLLSSFIALGANAQVSNNDNSDGPSAGVLCNKKKTRCTIGKFVMQSTASKPLFVSDGIVCNYKRTRCTNGYTMQSTTYPQY